MLPDVYGFADFTVLMVFALILFVDDFVDLFVFGSLDLADFSSMMRRSSFLRFRQSAYAFLLFSRVGCEL